MIPLLERYAARAFSLLHNHWCIVEGFFEFEEAHDGLGIVGHAELIDGSSLYIREVVKVEAQTLRKMVYSCQFRHEEEDGFFRYDSASHGRPIPYHHKHTSTGQILPRGEPPTLMDVLKEVEKTLSQE